MENYNDDVKDYADDVMKDKTLVNKIKKIIDLDSEGWELRYINELKRVKGTDNIAEMVVLRQLLDFEKYFYLIVYWLDNQSISAKYDINACRSAEKITKKIKEKNLTKEYIGKAKALAAMGRKSGKILLDLFAAQQQPQASTAQQTLPTKKETPTASITNTKYNAATIENIYNFCIDNSVFGEVIISKTMFLNAVNSANFSNIYNAEKTIKTKLRYMIYILNFHCVVDKADWYKMAAESIGVNKEDCSGTNISSDKWKKEAYNLTAKKEIDKDKKQ